MKKLLTIGAIVISFAYPTVNTYAALDATIDLGDPIVFTMRLSNSIGNLIAGTASKFSTMDYWRLSGELDKNYKENMGFLYKKIDYWVSLSLRNGGKVDTDDLIYTQNKLKKYCEWYRNEYQDIQSYKSTYNKWHKEKPIKSSGANFFQSCSMQYINSVLVMEIKDCKKKAIARKACKKNWGDE